MAGGSYNAANCVCAVRVSSLLMRLQMQPFGRFRGRVNGFRSNRGSVRICGRRMHRIKLSFVFEMHSAWGCQGCIA